jgi:very-short-patch-repair endonuclease
VSETIDKAIADLSRRQHGYVTRRQLLNLGLGSDAISYRQECGRLLPVYNGVYAVGHKPTLPQDRAFAAILACGPGALLSHASALSVWGIYRRWEMPFHVTVATARRREGIHVHRARLHRRDIDRQLGLPVTSPARTLLDNALELTEKALTRAVNDLRREHYLVLEDLAATLDCYPRYPGVTRLRQFIHIPTGPTASEFEDRFNAFCRRFNFPQPLVDIRIAGFPVDAYFPVERVIVELDGWDFHSSKASFESDRDRDATMLALGIVTVRITWERLVQMSEREAARLRVILESRRRPRA